MSKRWHFVATFLILLTMLLTACVEKWTTTIDSNYKESFDISEEMIEDYQIYKDGDSTCKGIPLEIALYQHGIEVIDLIDITDVDGYLYSLGDEYLINEICVSTDGSITFDGQTVMPATIFVRENKLVYAAKNIQDVTATTAHALGLEMEGLAGTSLARKTYDHVVLMFLDGFSYRTYKQASSEGLISNIEEGATVYQAISVYPPRTTTSSAALLTGLTPNMSGVNKSGIRSTEAKTIFDAATEMGLETLAIEGESLPFNMRNTDVILSGDRDQNGGTDDNTFANAMEALQSGVPDLVWIHFHGIDDMGHGYGPVTNEVLNKVVEVNGYVGQIKEILPESTLIIIFADHGMHLEKEGENKFGKHGHLISDDMVIPIFIQTK